MRTFINQIAKSRMHYNLGSLTIDGNWDKAAWQNVEAIELKFQL